MLTRAKSLLIVVCNPLNLQKDPQWREFIIFCLENNASVGNKIKLKKKSSETGSQQNFIVRVTETTRTNGEDENRSRKPIVNAIGRAEHKTRYQVHGRTQQILGE